MSYFSTEEVDNLKSLRAMVTEDLINETDYEDAKGTILAVAKKRRLSTAPAASADSFGMERFRLATRDRENKEPSLCVLQRSFGRTRQK